MKHIIELIDDGSLDTVISVNGREYRYSDVERYPGWKKELFRDAVNAFEENQAMHEYNPVTLDGKCVECRLGAQFHNIESEAK